MGTDSILRHQESCIINVELLQHTSSSKKEQDKEAQFLLIFFILVLEIVFLYIKENKNLRALMFLTKYSYILLMSLIWVNDKMFFVSGENSLTEVMNGFD